MLVYSVFTHERHLVVLWLMRLQNIECQYVQQQDPLQR